MGRARRRAVRRQPGFGTLALDGKMIDKPHLGLADVRWLAARLRGFRDRRPSTRMAGGDAGGSDMPGSRREYERCGARR